MSTSRGDLLIEIGTEELPPKALKTLSDAFATAIVGALNESRLGGGTLEVFATPRRLAVSIEDVAFAQEDREVTQKGPPVSIAFDGDDSPTKAGLAFAKKCGADVADLSREGEGDKARLVYTAIEKGAVASDLLPDIIAKALDALPAPRRMRWGNNDSEFVRPVHWLVVLHGSEVVPANIFNVSSDRLTRGHRFHTDEPITISSPADYADTLRENGYVIASFQERRDLIERAVRNAAESAGGTAIGDEALFDEVTALTEWPVAVTGTFDSAFLDLPSEVIVETLTSHQRYFPVADSDGKLLPQFITMANLESSDPDQVRSGNERVIQPRLADAAFFWQTDQQVPLARRANALKKVVYQKGLGTLYDKGIRVAVLAAMLAEQTGADTAQSTRAATLAKCDLLTGMVGEFPALQGVMGGYYASSGEEPAEVAHAIGEHYLPRFAGDELPKSSVGQVLAVADRLDTLAGIFLLGKKPTGNRDPFGLRRAALGIIRILVERKLDVNLNEAIVAATTQQPIDDEHVSENRRAMYEFIIERLRGYLVDGDGDFTPDMFEAVRTRHPSSLVDFHERLLAVADFFSLDAANSLAAANKRIANILRKAEIRDVALTESAVNTELLQDDAERQLFDALQEANEDVSPLIEQRHYSDALRRLAELRTTVDMFFEDVMVMAEDDALKTNRLALLSELRSLFLKVADVSRLTPSQE